MIALERPSAPAEIAPVMCIVPRGVRRRRGHPNNKIYGVFLIVAVFATIDGGWLFDTGSGLVLQARGAALHAYWALMRAEGVPGEELAQLDEEWAQTQETMVLGAGASLWWPGASGLVNRWQSETEAIWTRSVTQSREAALATHQNLNQARSKGPFLDNKSSFDAFSAAQTPGEFNALRAEWALEAKLVSIDKMIQGAAGVVAAQVDQAKGLGIRSDPGPDLLSVAGAYTQLLPQEKMAKAEFLTRRLSTLQKDLKGRLDAATGAQESLQHAADVVGAAELYGINVSGLQARIAGARGVYANALKVSEFSDTAAAANQVAAEADHSIYVVLSQTHIVYGVQFIYQNHSLSCEEAATSMALTHQGIYVSQDQILAELGADTRPMYVDGQGRVRWGNPYQTFVGNVNGSEGNWTGFGTFYPPGARTRNTRPLFRLGHAASRSSIACISWSQLMW